MILKSNCTYTYVHTHFLTQQNVIYRLPKTVKLIAIYFDSFPFNDLIICYIISQPTST